MSTHIIGFCVKNKKNIDTFRLEKGLYLMLYQYVKSYIVFIIPFIPL